MAKKSLGAIKANLLWMSLLLGMSLLSAQGLARADDVKVITDIKGWQHPVKDVFRKFNVVVSKVKLHNNNTYPIFFVKFKYDPQLGHNDRYFKPLYYETLKANGFGDYAFISSEDNCRINIKWDKKTKTLTEDLITLQ